MGRSLLQQRALKRQAKVALTYTCDARCESQVCSAGTSLKCDQTSAGNCRLQYPWRCGGRYLLPCPAALQRVCTGVCTRDGPCQYGAERCMARVQVKLLEAVILAINLIVAVLVGTCMLHNLGTPTRFEMPKETTQREM